jgi:hypothetical protein
VVVTDSSTIDRMEFDPNTQNLLVTFNTGSRYIYHPVSNAVFGAVVGADSVGQRFNELVKESDSIAYNKVD